MHCPWWIIVYTNMQPEANLVRMPRCTWVGDSSNPETPDTIRVHFPTFVKDGANDPDTNPGNYCGGRPFRTWKNGQVVPSQDSSAKTKRSLHSEFVVSSFKQHKAEELCDSETSLGPDSVSTAEGLFCDMETREVLPLCGNGVDVECFELEQGAKVKRDGVSRKTYSKTITWGP